MMSSKGREADPLDRSIDIQVSRLRNRLHVAFEPVFRGDASRSRETGGTGLGLGIARNIARAHGGDLVNVPSATGARFVLTLPLNRSA